MVFFYENEFPEIDELVMVIITNVSDIGIMCQLLEYNHIEGFITNRFYKKLIVGKKYILKITNVDIIQKYIELTNKYLSENDIETGTLKYNQGKTVKNIIKRIAEVKLLDIDILYKQMIYPLFNDYDTAYDGFKQFNINDNIFDYYKLMHVHIDIIELMHKLIKQQFMIQPIKLAFDFKLNSYVNGIVDIKYALMKGKESISKEHPLKIQLVSSPIFTMSLVTFNEKEGINIINQVIDVIHKEIIQLGGHYSCDQPIYIIN